MITWQGKSWLAVVWLVLLAPTLAAQSIGTLPVDATRTDRQPVGYGSGLWNWTPAADYHHSIVEVTTDHGSGTGVLIEVDRNKPVKDGYEGLVLTAWHVIQDDITDGSIKVTYRINRRAKGCRVVEYDEETDVAILWVWVPEGVQPAALAADPVQVGDPLELAGLGGGTDLHHCVRAFSAAASPPTKKKIYADVPLLPGDSGGPVFNANHEVVGVISGGWFWFESQDDTGHQLRTTWPARACNLGPIHRLMKNIRAQTSVAHAVGTTLKR